MVAPKRAAYAGPNCRTAVATVIGRPRTRTVLRDAYKVAINEFTVAWRALVTVGVMCV